ncbi:MAG: hypothetical protein AAF824_21905 [Bacteroidota bacterium]
MHKPQKYWIGWLFILMMYPSFSPAQTHYPVSILPIPDFHMEALPKTYNLIEKSGVKSTNLNILFKGSETSFNIIRYRVRGLIIDEFPRFNFNPIFADPDDEEMALPLITLDIVQIQNYQKEKKWLKRWPKIKAHEQLILYLPEDPSIADLSSKSRKKVMKFCKKRGLGFIDIPPNWNKYVEEHKLRQEEMFRKGKINDHGEYVIAGIIYQYFMLPF